MEKRRAHRQESVVLQDDRLAITQVFCNPPSLLAIQYHAAELRVHRMILIEPQTVLRNHVQLPPKYRERLPIHAMCMARRVDIRPCFVDLAVDRKGGGIDGLIADDDLALFVDENKVRDRDQREVFGQRVEPEVVGEDGIANGDVACDAFVEALCAFLISILGL